MMSAPEISIVMPCYKGERYVALSIESCLRQTASNFELIIVDDGSPDRCAEIAADYAARDARIRVLRMAKNSGISSALNAGFAVARGEFFTRLAQDDVFQEHSLARMVEALRARPEAGMLYCDENWVDDSGKILRFVPRPEPAEALANNNNLGLCVMWRRSVWAAVGQFDSQYDSAEDFDYWMRIKARYPLAHLGGEPLLDVRIHHEMGSIQFSGKQEVYAAEILARHTKGAKERQQILARGYFDAAFNFKEQGKFEEAARCLRRAIENAPVSGKLYKAAFALLFARAITEAVPGMNAPHALRTLKHRARSGAISVGVRLARPFFGGIGCICALHRVAPREECSTIPENRALEITPDDLRALLEWVRQLGLEPICLDELPERLRSPNGQKSIVFTSDDGYRDNVEHAAPIFRDAGIPWTLNVTTGLIDRTTHAWWFLIERAITRRQELSFQWEGRRLSFAAGTPAQRHASFNGIAALVREQGRATRDGLVEAICQAAGFAPAEAFPKLMATWEELRGLAADPLVTFGCHTIGHHGLSQLSDGEVREELTGANRRLFEELRRPIRHLAYPFGNPSSTGTREFRLAAECGFATAATTRIANLFPEHRYHLTALPRLSLSGNFPVIERMERLESGFISAVSSRFQKVIVD